MNIRKRLVLYFLASILIPSVIITIVVYIGSTNIINKKMNELIEKNLDSARLNVQERLEFAYELTTLISFNPMIQEVLGESPSDDLSDNVTQIIKVDRALDSYYLSNYYVTSHSAIVPKLYFINRPEYHKYDISSKVQDISQVEHEPWYHNIGTKNMAVYASPDQDHVILSRRMFSLKNADRYDYAALLTIELEKASFIDVLSNYRPSKESKICIMDPNNQILMSSDTVTKAEVSLLQSLQKGADTAQIMDLNKGKAIVTVKTLDNIDWKIVNITNLSEVNSDQTQLTRNVVLLLLLCMTTALLAAFFLSRNISSPITKLVKSMRNVRGNNFDIDITYNKKDEFGYLILQYKQMIGQIKDLIEKLYVSDLNKQRAELHAKDAELKVLQAQINPHFLYNTLDSINMYAIKYNAPVICRMINSLANFYRYSLSKGREIITLEEEISHTNSYLEIQSSRFGPKLRYSIQIPRELRAFKIVKLVIQPLVENSIIHGFHQKIGELEILITASRIADKIVISIIDNGVGADVDDLNRLLTSNCEKEHSFAIKNVHQRLQNTFGEGYGIRYLRNQIEGITVEVTIPTYYSMEETDDNDSSSRR
ncbi:cache domain-containing sensor histidine kinase [Cohnella abietis]|uniref:Histidine kinase n=1 Tax=Cohnella abietis TaxID=2507935 RepID=A0A3T1DFD8_9BACL|nr:sensor histidine kinase [Cohnella abietis]BBI36595.1 histidine kinase [Cohnella abietis]